MLMSMAIFVNAADFSDLSADHWAYKNIDTLVSEGTINGYEDGTFRPSKSVTRAEFVKMIGKWDKKYDGTYSDISKNHWAYEYIMWSGLDAYDSYIKPDTEIKRYDVINLIWKRNGSPKSSEAPGAIISQGTKSDATSWAYTIGLMKGDDGLNLRLDSSLTRAEAATLIVRSRELVKKNEKHNFIDVVGEEVLKQTFETLDLLGGVAYDSDKVLTYGEVARMSVVFGADGNETKLVGADRENSKGEEFKELPHKYDKEMFLVSSKVWGDEYYTLEKIDTPITKQDAITAIMYGFTRRGTAPLVMGARNDYYPDCKTTGISEWENIYLTFAKKNGVKLYTNDLLDASGTLTHKEYAAFLVLFNDAVGLGVAYTQNGKTNTSINTAGSMTPANVLDFKYTIEGAPLGIYQLKKNNVSAESYYKQANFLSSTYCGYLSQVVALAKEKTGATIAYTYYPSLAYKQDGKVTFTAKFDVIDIVNSFSIPVDSLLFDVIKTPTNYTVDEDGEFYVVFETHTPLMDVFLPYTDASVKAVFVK